MSGTGYRGGRRHALQSAPDVSTVRGLRDRAMLAVLLGCGLRQSEVAGLTFAMKGIDSTWGL